MSATLLEAKAIISAEDRTGPVFAALERKIESLSKHASAIGRAAGPMAAATNRMAAATAAVSSSGGMLAAGGLASRALGYAGMAAGVGGAIAAHKAAHAATERAHERVRMATAGMSDDEMRDAEVKAAEIAAKVPSIGQTTIMHMLRNARTIAGTYEEAAHIMEPMAKLRVVAQNANPGADVSEDFDKLLKGLEIKGVTQNPKQFHEYMEGIAKGLNAFGDTLKPYQYYEMFKYGRQATPMLSEKFMLSTAPALAQELGGSSYGKAVSAFNSAIVNNVMKHSALKDFAKLGLIDNGDLDFTKTGEAKGLKPGRHVRGWQTAQSDPNEWVKQYLLPALVKAGVTDKDEQVARIGTLFQNQMASQLVGILATQQGRIAKDAVNYLRALGLNPSVKKIQDNDPYSGGKALWNSLEGVAGQIGGDMAKSLSGPMTDLAKAVAGYTAELARMHKDREEHPGQPSGGQKKANKWLDAIFGPSPLTHDEVHQRKRDSVAAERRRLSEIERAGADPVAGGGLGLRRAQAQQQQRLDAQSARIADMEARLASGGAGAPTAADMEFSRRPPPRISDVFRNRGVLEDTGFGGFAPGGIGAPGAGLPTFANGRQFGEGPGPKMPNVQDLSNILNGKITAQAEVHGTFDPARLDVTFNAGSDLITLAGDARRAIQLISHMQQSSNGQSMPAAEPARQ